MSIYLIERTVNFGCLSQIEPLRGVLNTGEAEAHKFVIHASRNLMPEPLTGSVSGAFVRPDKTTVPLTGAIVDGAAEVTLGAACYTQPGMCSLAIFVTDGTRIQCGYRALVSVSQATTDQIIDPAGTITASVAELIAAIDAAVESIPVPYDNLLDSIADTYSTSQTYAVGDYVWYYDGENKYLYRCVEAIETAESWTEAHWTLVVLGDQIAALNRAAEKNAEVLDSTAEGPDLDISDEDGNVILRLEDGHIKTKEFDSSNINIDPDLVRDSEAVGPDLDISDDYGNVLARFEDGGLLTKQYDARRYVTFRKAGMFVLGDPLTLTINRSFKKGDRIVLHVERNAAPWDSGGRVVYSVGSTAITDSDWRGDCAWIEYQLKEDVSSVSASYAGNGLYASTALVFEVSLLGDIPIEPKVVTIKKDGTGDYTNLKACLADIGFQANDVLNPYRIEIYPGTYDVLDDYTQAELEDIYWGEISVNQYSQTSFVGPKLLNGMSLIGMGRPEDVILTAWLDPEPQTDVYKRMRGQISTLNLQGSGGIENLTIIAQNMRYCVHDDFSAPLGKKCGRTVKNCVFRGYNIAYGPHTTYGAGMPQSGMDFLFVGCDFGEDVGVHTQPLLYHRPEIHLIDCKGHSFRIGDNETVSPVTEYTVYRLDNCDFLDIRHGMEDSVPHAKIRGVGGSDKFYQADPQVEYNTGEVKLVPPDVLGTALTVGTCVEMYNDNSSGPRFRAITDLDNFAGIVVFVDADDNTYIQTRGYVRTDRLGLTTFSLNDYVGLDGTDCAVVGSAADAFGKIAYIDYAGKGYVKLGGKF